MAVRKKAVRRKATKKVKKATRKAAARKVVRKKVKKARKAKAAKKVKKATKKATRKAPARKKTKKAKKTARKKARRTVMRSSAGKKLYAVRSADGQFKDIQTYARAHAADLRKKAKDE